MSTSSLTFRPRPVLAVASAVLFGLLLSMPADARPGGGGGGGGGRGGGGGGFGGGGGGFSGGHGGGSFGGNFSHSGSISAGGGGKQISSRPPRPTHPIAKPPVNRPDRPVRPDRPGNDLPWIPGAGVWWGATIAADSSDYDMVYALPRTGCQQVMVREQRYAWCGDSWYQKVFYGNQVAYAAVADPR